MAGLVVENRWLFVHVTADAVANVVLENSVFATVLFALFKDELFDGRANFVEVESLPGSGRGDGGFGSTGRS